MVSRCPEMVCRACLVVGAIFLCLGPVSRTAAEPPVHFVAPASDTEPTSTVTMTDGVEGLASALLEPEAIESGAPSLPATDFEPIDLTALASYAQAAAEEIEGDPMLAEERPFRPITQVTINAALPAGALPGQPGTAADDETPMAQPEFFDARLWGGWAGTNFQWSATKLCHRPLYFEEVNLERYGYTVSPLLQPAISGAHFFLTIPTLPYKMVVQPPRECVYTLGYYRSGSPAPRRWHHMDLVWDPTAVTVEGLVVTGLVFLIP